MKNKKFLKYIIAAVVVIIIFSLVAKKAGWIGGKGVTEVYTEKSIKRTINEMVSANGKVQPERQVKISPDVSGEVIELYVKEGDEVKAGQLLAKIDPDIYVSNVERMNATLNNMKANSANSKARLSQVKSQFENAKATYERNKQLFAQGAISQSDFDAAKSAFEVAKAEVDASEQTILASDYSVKSTVASVKEAEKNLNKTSIYAPVDGIISKLNIEKGERVVGTTQFAGTEIMTIANINLMEVVVQVNENDIIRVKLNDTADVEVDAYLNRKFKGLVTEISTSANTTGVTADQVTNFDVKIRILKDSYTDLLVGKPSSYTPFRPGMSATVDIKTKKVDNALSIPIQAVTTRLDSTGNAKTDDKGREPQEGESVVTNKNEQTPVKEEEVKEYVFVYNNGVVEQRLVKTGIQDNTYIQITEGLKEGDEVVIGPYSVVQKQLKNKETVKKVDKAALQTKE
ncbi:MAG: efflux RND transporter periplasmic adaptor subunit [Bacteroidota bacterium]